MISKEEAQMIAHEHIDGVILQESCEPNYVTLSQLYPRSWIFNIYHRNYDKDTFHTIIEINSSGIVINWDKIYVSDESGE